MHQVASPLAKLRLNTAKARNVWLQGVFPTHLTSLQKGQLEPTACNTLQCGFSGTLLEKEEVSCMDIDGNELLSHTIYIYIYAHNYLSINPSIYLNIVHTYHTLYINIHKIQRHIEAPSSRPRLGGNTSHSPAPAHHLSSHPHLGCWEIHQWTKRGKQ